LAQLGGMFLASAHSWSVWVLPPDNSPIAALDPLESLNQAIETSRKLRAELEPALMQASASLQYGVEPEREQEAAVLAGAGDLK
jgi:hypothetical protein